MIPDYLVEATPRFMLVALATGAALYALARVLAEVSETVAKVLGPLGRRWITARDMRLSRLNVVDDLQDKVQRRDAAMAQMQAEIDHLRKMRDSDAENADLRRQVAALVHTVDRLRDREVVNEAYLVYDHGWHRSFTLGDRENLPEHVPYLEYERRYRSGQEAAPPPPNVSTRPHKPPRRAAPDH